MALLYEPYWKARDDIARTIISLSSVIVALTVSFPTAMSPSTSTCWRYLLIAGWLFLLLSILTALASLWQSQRAREIASALFTPKAENYSDTTPEVTGDAATELYIEIDRAVGPPAIADVCAGKLLRVSFVLFALGMICVGVVGARKVLS